MTQTNFSIDGVYPQALTVEDFERNLTNVRNRINAACNRTSRSSSEVRLLPVSKTVEEKYIRLAHEAGCYIVGENKVQEAYRKWQAMADLTHLQWSVIGHLQTNRGCPEFCVNGG